MPKVNKKRISRVLLHFPQDNTAFKMHPEGVFCEICGIVLTTTTKFSLETHANTAKHRNNSQRSLVQTQINPDSNIIPKSVIDFEEDLIKTFLAADIPLHKLGNAHLQNLFETYAGKKLPSVYKARTNYVPKLYTESIAKLSQKLNGKKLWVRKMSNILFWWLRVTVAKLQFILSSYEFLIYSYSYQLTKQKIRMAGTLPRLLYVISKRSVPIHI